MEFAYSLAHFFYPKSSNNHKAKLLHSSTLFLLAILLLSYQVFLQIFPLSGAQVLGYAANISPDEVIRLTNEKRSENGVPPLSYNAALASAAKAKGEHMIARDYWAHTAPDGTEPWKFFTDVGYKYRYAGENLARDFSNPESAVDAWMASPSHKDNLLSTKYKEIGVAVVEGDLAGNDTTIIVQLFGTQLVDTTPQLPIAEARQSAVQITPTVRPTQSIEPTMVPSVTSTPTLIPTATPTTAVPFAISEPKEGTLVSANEPASQRNTFQILISPFQSTKDISLVTTVLLLIVLVVDGVVVTRRRITRLGGRTFAHLAFLGMILAIVLIAKAGQIL